jgi:penicillin-binding protein 1B
LLELRFSKEEILERYLNEVYLGQVGSYEVHGVSEGAKYFFSKRLDELNLSEIALMAGLIRGPAYYSPYRHPERAFERQKLVLEKMVETGQISEEEAQEAKDQKVNLAPPVSVSNKAPYFVDYVKAQLMQEVAGRLSTEEVLSRGFRIYTTLDSYWNRLAQDVVWKHLKDFSGIEGAVAIEEHHTGKIRVLIGGKNYSQSQFNRILNMKRQAGSTFKPFVFLAAIEERSDGNGVPFGPAYPLEDAPWTLVYDHGRQRWSPKNYEKEFRGWVTAQQVLAHSINTATARLAARVGLDPIIKLAHDCGIVSELPKVPSISLGSADVSPMELLNAYAVIANQGIEQERHVIRLITEEDGVPFARFLPKETKRVESSSVEVLRQMMETVFTEGTAKKASEWGWKRSAAGKTGTTTQHRDAWFAGFSPQLTAVVWVGEDLQTDPDNKTTTQKVRLTGAGNALPIWAELMTQLHSELPWMDFSNSEANVEVKIDRYTGRLALSDCDETQVIWARYPKWVLDMARSCESSYPESEKETKVDEF